MLCFCWQGKKRIRAGHKASATRMLGRVDGILAETGPDGTPDMSVLSTLQLTIKALDEEILNLTGDDDEIEQADTFRGERSSCNDQD